MRKPPFVNNSAVMMILTCLFSFFLSPAVAEPLWRPIGDTNGIVLSATGDVRINADQPATCGIISAPVKVDTAADAVLIEADVSDAAIGAFTLAADDAADGDTVGYWRNSIMLTSCSNHIAAVLPLSRYAPRIRIFAGTHHHTSHALIKNISYKILRRGISCHGAVYGAGINRQCSLRQTIRATGNRIGAVVVRIRQDGKYAVNGPDLLVRLYSWRGTMTGSTSRPPLTEVRIPRGRIPGVMQGGATDELDLSASYIGNACDLSVPLSAPTVRGRTYVLELAVDKKNTSGRGFISYCWLNGYSGGRLYENNSDRGRNSDLWMEVYYDTAY